VEAAMSVVKIAHVPPATVETNATVLDAVQVMAEEGVGAVAVMEKGELRGIFTERDLMLRVVLRNRSPKEATMAEVMTSPPKTAPDQTTAEDALNFMVENHVRHLPVVSKEGKLLGMLSIRNVLEHMVEDLQRELHSLDQYLLNDGPGG
jgi:CBS domain-containing protein